MITASRFMQSPVGPYLQLAVALPARLGGRFGWCVTHLVVDKQDARTGARLNWGFPAELGTLRWREDGPERELLWEEREVVVRGHARGPKIPERVAELYKQAAGPFREEAEHGNARAQFTYGEMCEYGRGVDRNLDEARRWYRGADAQGYPRAKEALARLAKPQSDK